MRVLFLSDAPTVSGAELVMLAHVEALRAHGHSAHVAFRHSNQRLRDELAHRGVPYTSVGTFSRAEIRTTLDPAALREFARAFRATRDVLRRTLARERPQVVHCVSYPAVLYGVLGAWGTDTAVIWHEHNIKRLHAVNKRILRAVGGRCRWILGPSDAVTHNLAATGIGAARLRTLYNGIDLARFRPDPEAARLARAALGLDVETRTIGLPGQLLPYKGHHALIDAAPAVIRDFPDARFFFLGALENPPYERELRARLASLGLQDRFAFTGWRPDIHQVLQAMDVVVVPTTRPEPAALTLLEGMALRRAVVATRTGGTPELIVDGETGLLVAPGDAAALAAAVARILHSPELATRLGDAGRRRVESLFTLERHRDAVLQLYQDLTAAA